MAAGEIMSKSVQNIVHSLTDESRGERVYTTNLTAVKGLDCERINSTRLKRYCESIGLSSEDNHFVPQFIFEAQKECQVAYLRALFSADGTVNDNIGKGASVRLSFILSCIT